MSKLLGVVMDPIRSINYHKDTTLALLLAAQNHGYELFYMEQKSLFIDSTGPSAKMSPLKVHADSNSWYELGDSTFKPLGDLDVILMRKMVDYRGMFLYGLLDIVMSVLILVSTPIFPWILKTDQSMHSLKYCQNSHTQQK